MKLRIILFFLVLLHNGFKGAIVSLVFPGFDQPASLLTFAGDLVMILLLATSLKRTRGFYGGWIVLAFLLSSVFTLLYNIEHVGVLGHLSALREPLIFLSSLVVIYDFMTSDFNPIFIRVFTYFVAVFAIVQIPVAFIQYREFGPSDHVGGTLGYGGSGILSQLLFLIVFYLIVRFATDARDERFSFFRVMFFLPLLIPCALNETKISFVYLLLMVVFLTPTKRVLRAIPVVATGIALFYFLNMFYSQNVQDTDRLIDESYIEKYLLYDERTSVDVPRFQKLQMMFDLLVTDMPTTAVGLGYGAFGGKIIGASGLAKSLAHFRGSRMLLNTLWLQGGIIAVLLVAYASLRIVNWKTTLANINRFKWFLSLVVLSVWFYNEALLNRTFAIMVAFFIVWIQVGGSLENNDDEGSLEEQGFAEEDTESHEAFAHR